MSQGLSDITLWGEGGKKGKEGEGKKKEGRHWREVAGKIKLNNEAELCRGEEEEEEDSCCEGCGTRQVQSHPAGMRRDKEKWEVAAWIWAEGGVSNMPPKGLLYTCKRPSCPFVLGCTTVA